MSGSIMMRAMNDRLPLARSTRRTEIRMPVRLSGRLEIGPGRILPVQVTDVSRRGARCQVAAPPAAGSVVELHMDGLTVRATICWALGASCGLMFDQPIRATLLLLLAARSRGAPAVAPFTGPAAPPNIR